MCSLVHAMKNVKQIWEETAKQLEKVYDLKEAENVSHLLLEDAFGIKKVDILASENKPLDENLLYQSIERLLQYEPIQYVTGFADFYGRKFRIRQGALIPRPETEELCELIINDNDLENPRIFDVGVGSGCIAITLALEIKSEVFGTDVSKHALSIAKENASTFEVAIEFEKSDVLKERLPFKDLDILVSNPPYIPVSDKSNMHENVLQHEPDLALFVPNDDPLLFYRMISEKGKNALKNGGKLYFEIHERYGIETCKLLESIGYSKVLIHTDMQGKNRMISAINSTNK